jgi:hypothetical protein
MSLPQPQSVPLADDQAVLQHVTSFEEWRNVASVWSLNRLRALWNALPGVSPVQKFTSRAIASERIWRCVHGPAEKQPRRSPGKEEGKNPFRDGSKAAQVYALLCRPEGASTRDLQEITGWQAHSVRGFLSAGVRKQGHKLRSFSRGGRRVYRLRG